MILCLSSLGGPTFQQEVAESSGMLYVEIGVGVGGAIVVIHSSSRCGVERAL
jgi:hypothetical protein